METVRDRLYEFINYIGITGYTMELAIGKTRSYLRNSRNISSEVLSRICKVYPELNPTWVLTGEGNITREPIVRSEVVVGDSECAKVRDRLIDFIRCVGVTPEEFEKDCQLPTGLISHINHGISSSSIKKICTRYPQLNIYWLIGIPGQRMLIPDYDEITLARLREGLKPRNPRKGGVNPGD